MFSLFNIFRIIAFLEGISYILLLFIATPVKYLFDEPQYVKLLGMPHGLLFIIYVILAFMINSEMKWDKSTLFKVLVASVIPFGTFYIDRNYLNKVKHV